MEIQNLYSEITIVGGRPATGKSAIARTFASSYLRRRKQVIFYHAEGPMELSESEFEFYAPDEVSFLDYVPNIFVTGDELLNRFDSARESLFVIDTIELLDCEPVAFLSRLRKVLQKSRSKAIVLTQIPRSFESRPKDVAEDFVRRKLKVKSEEEIVILGDFPLEDINPRQTRLL